MVKSPLSPERITKTNNKNLEGALKFVSGGSPLGSSVVSSAANKIVGFNRAKVSPKQTNFKSLIETLSSNIFNNISSVQNVFNNKTEKKEKGMSFFSGIFDKVKEALAFVRFFGEKKNLDKIKTSLNNLKDTFGETFEVAKALRKAIVKIFKELSGINASGGGGGLGNILSAIGGLLGGLIPGRKGAKGLPRGARALEGEGNMFSKIPKMMKSGGGGIGKLLLGGGLTAGGIALSGLSAGAGNTEYQPGETPTEIPGNLLDKFNSILDRFDKVLDGLMKGGKGPKGAGSGAKSSGSGTTPPGTTPPPGPGAPPGVTIKDDKQGLSELGITQEQFNAYKQGIADVEGARYNQMGGAGGRFAGRYQMGSGEIASASAVMGIPNPSQQEYLSNPELQEKIYMGRTILMNRRMMQLSPEYKGMSATERLSNLAGAQLGEGSLTDFLKGKSVSDSAGVEIQRWINSAKRRLNQVAAGKPIPAPPVSTSPQQQITQTQGLSVQRGQGKSSVVVLPGAQQQTSTQQSGGGQLVAPPSPAKSGPQMPRLLTSNPDNFLNLYSKMVYNIIDG